MKLKILNDTSTRCPNCKAYALAAGYGYYIQKRNQWIVNNQAKMWLDGQLRVGEEVFACAHCGVILKQEKEEEESEVIETNVASNNQKGGITAATIKNSVLKDSPVAADGAEAKK